jgi:hypothetical protein
MTVASAGANIGIFPDVPLASLTKTGWHERL